MNNQGNTAPRHTSGAKARRVSIPTVDGGLSEDSEEHVLPLRRPVSEGQLIGLQKSPRCPRVFVVTGSLAGDSMRDFTVLQVEDGPLVVSFEPQSLGSARPGRWEKTTKRGAPRLSGEHPFGSWIHELPDLVVMMHL